jgi:hypothetical protein
MTQIFAPAAGAGFVLAVLLALAPAAPSHAQTQPEAAPPARGGTELTPAERRRPQERRSGVMRAFDLDRDGTLSLAETKSAAAKRYDDLDPDLDDSMTRDEAGKHKLGAAAFKTADANRDGKVSKAEWLALVERRFTDADPDHDGTLDAAELKTKPGKALSRFLR